VSAVSGQIKGMTQGISELFAQLFGGCALNDCRFVGIRPWNGRNQIGQLLTGYAQVAIRFR